MVLFDGQRQTCASCESFAGLYEVLQTREQEHTALLGRGPKHHGRAIAYGKYRSAKVALENSLIDIQAPDGAVFDVASPASADLAERFQLKRDDLGGAPEEDDDPINHSSSVESVHDTQCSLVMKRKMASKALKSNVERKRIKFNDAVEERTHYRSTLEYYRGANEYVPGRYVPAEGSEFWDTSGSTLTFAKFTGQRKVGSTFVDIVLKEETEESEEAPTTAQCKDRVKCAKASNQPEKSLADPAMKDDKTSDRELRSFGKLKTAMATPPAVIATRRPRRVVARYDGQDGGDVPSDCVPTLALNLKEVGLATADILTVGNGRTRTTLSTGKGRQRRGATNVQDAAKKSTEVANVKGAVSSMQRKADQLQQVTTSPRHGEPINADGHTFIKVLEPLRTSARVEPNLANESEGSQEEDSIYFDALDTLTCQMPNEQPETSGQDVSSLGWNQIPTANEGPCTADIGVALRNIAFFASSDQDRQIERTNELDDTSLRAAKYNSYSGSTPNPSDRVEVATVSNLTDANSSSSSPGSSPNSIAIIAADDSTLRPDEVVSPPKKPAFLTKLTMEALPAHTTRAEVVHKAHRACNGDQSCRPQSEGDSLSADVQCESIDPSPGTATPGTDETKKQSGLQIADTNRRGAGEKEADVDPVCMACGSVALSALNGQGSSAELKHGEGDESTDTMRSDTASWLLHGLERSPSESEDRNEANINGSAVRPSVDKHTTLIHVGGQNGPAHSIGATTTSYNDMGALGASTAAGADAGPEATHHE